MKKLLLLLLFIPLISIGQEISKEYFDNGNLAGEGKMIDGLKEGNWKAYYETGEILAEINFTEGLPNGKVVKYYKNGKFLSIGNTVYGSNEGETIAYCENGNLSQKLNFKDNKWHGDYQFYYCNGNLMETGTFFEGRKKGTTKIYDTNGKIESERFYKGNEKTQSDIYSLERLQKTAKDLGESLEEFGEKDEKGKLAKYINSLRWFADLIYMNPLYSTLMMIVIGIIWYVIRVFKS